MATVDSKQAASKPGQFVLHKREMEAPIISHHTLSSAAATLSLFLFLTATARRIAQVGVTW